ncbi:hypothetical protein ElyMa_006504700 [Elysia marginata]|uniref:Reverse transcriptase domain-containing protein n=1 Tax=Elysia marginata TaxID=1093978 RepID=A0AAV4I3K7_9GAST|nr:hypothetical protein ElyMa_006504700 [Elysia marginata]
MGASGTCKPWWNPELDEAIKECSKLRKEAAKCDAEIQLTSCTDLTEVEALTQEALHVMEKRTQSWKMTINFDKSEVIHFKDANWRPSLTINGLPFKYYESPTFLGRTYEY